jgi:ribosome-binding protein aMBF1 (putative translation factor)
MNWDEYKAQAKQEDPAVKEIIEEAEAEARIITAIIKQRSELGLSRRDLAKLCSIPQSSVARIETGKTVPKISTLLNIMAKLGLTLTPSRI